MSICNEDILYASSVEELNPTYVINSMNELCFKVNPKDDATSGTTAHDMFSDDLFAALDPLPITKLVEDWRPLPTLNPLPSQGGGVSAENILDLDFNDGIYVSLMNNDLGAEPESIDHLQLLDFDGGIRSFNPDKPIIIERGLIDETLTENPNSSEQIFVPVQSHASVSGAVATLPNGNDILSNDCQPSCSNASDTDGAAKPRRRRRKTAPKEKLYMKTEPFEDTNDEKRRLNALKAKNNRTKQKMLLTETIAENKKLQSQLQKSKAKIHELEQEIAGLRRQEDVKQRKLTRIRVLRDELTSIIGDDC